MPPSLSSRSARVSSVCSGRAASSTMSWLLGEDFRNHFAAVHRRPLVAAVVEVGELEVVQAHEVEDGGVDVVDVDGVVDGPEADFVCGADDPAAPDAAAGHEHGESPGIMV